MVTVIRYHQEALLKVKHVAKKCLLLILVKGTKEENLGSISLSWLGMFLTW